MKGPTKASGIGGTLTTHGGRDARRKVVGRAIDKFFPDLPHHANAAPDIKGDVAYCISCHAIYRPKQWHLDEAEYHRLSINPEVEGLTCPSCRAIERGDFYGELRLHMAGLERFREQILNTVYNEEARARVKNPHERIGRLIDRGGEIQVDTVNPFLAHRLAGTLRKAFHGTAVDTDYTPGQVFARIAWGKTEAKR